MYGFATEHVSILAELTDSQGMQIQPNEHVCSKTSNRTSSESDLYACVKPKEQEKSTKQIQKGRKTELPECLLKASYYKLTLLKPYIDPQE